MMMSGTTWLIFMAIFAILTIINMVFWGAWNDIILKFPVPAPVQSYVGQTFWIQPFSYFLILVLALIVTYAIIQKTADESDYSAERWGGP
jgi:hypothetical protein